jgi:uncharacterized protein
MAAMTEIRTAHYPGRAPIDAYGNGGFRFADMSHRGSILCLPDGIFGWEAPAPNALEPGHLATAVAALTPPGFLLLGTGEVQVFPTAEIVAQFAEAGLGLGARVRRAGPITCYWLKADPSPPR